MNFDNFEQFGDFKIPSRIAGSYGDLRSKVSAAVTKSAHAAGHYTQFYFGLDIIGTLKWKHGDKIQVAVSEDGRQLAFRKADEGWTLCGKKTNDKLPSQLHIGVADYYIDKQYVRTVKKLDLNHVVFGDKLIVEIKELNRKAQ